MHRMKTTTMAVALAAGLLIALAPAQEPQPTPGAAQQAPAVKRQPQAQSQEELDTFNKLVSPSLSADQMITLADEFVQKYPDSELLGHVYRGAMEGYRLKNDFRKMLEFGEKALAVDPEDGVTLLLLALAIPERTRETDLGRDQKLNKAEEYAKRALAAIDKMQKPNPMIADAEWDRMRNDVRGQSHAALGFVAMHRKQYPAAEDFFKKSIELQPEKDPIVLWRLGRTYEFMKKYELARDALKEAVEMGGVKVPGRGDLAAKDLQRVEKEFNKQ